MNSSGTLKPIENKWIYGLDSLRFVLALIVMMSHMPDYLKDYKNIHNPLFAVIKGISALAFCGPAAVIAFFVLSGFVIHFPNRKSNQLNIGSYLIRRVLRIGGPLLIIGLVVGYYGMYNTIPAWSLYCELFYYLLYPLLLKLNISWKKQVLYTFVLAYVIILAFNFNGILSLLHQKNIHYEFGYWGLGTIGTTIIGLPCWLLGVQLASKIDSLDYSLSYKKLWLFRLTAYFISCFLLLLNFHFYVSYMLTLNFFALFVVKWIEREIVYYRNHNTNKVLEYMGKFSYSLYLCHRPLGILIGVFIVYNIKTLPVFVALSLLGAFLIYLAVEFPTHKLGQYLSMQYNKRFAGTDQSKV